MTRKLSKLLSDAARPERDWRRAAPARLMVLLMLSLLPGSPVRAQYTTAEISGVVKDAQGAMIPAANAPSSCSRKILIITS